MVSVPREAKEGERERKTKNISHRIKNSKEFEDNPTLTFRARFSSFLVAYAPLYRLADRAVEMRKFPEELTEEEPKRTSAVTAKRKRLEISGGGFPRQNFIFAAPQDYPSH